MNEEDLIRKCKVSKPKSMFYRYKYCKKCHISYHILNGRVANCLNLSMDELNNILKNDNTDPTRNEIGEQERYDEVMLLLTDLNMSSFRVLTDNMLD
jgi:hypothetical protein